MVLRLETKIKSSLRFFAFLGSSVSRFLSESFWKHISSKNLLRLFHATKKRALISPKVLKSVSFVSLLESLELTYNSKLSFYF